MPIVITPNVSPVVAQGATAAPVVLQPGSVISVRVQQVLSNDTVRIAIGSHGFPFNLSDRIYPAGLCPVAEAMRDTHLLQFQPVSWDADDEQVDMMIEAFHKVHRHAGALAEAAE